MKVAVSFLKSKFDIKDTINKIDNSNADFIHVDVMDGVFVPNKVNDYNSIKEYLTNTIKPLDVHLMVENPIKYIMDYKNLFPYIITIHSEIDKNIDDLIDLIHSFNIKAGISIKPDTSIINIEKYLSKIDNILIMSVNPGMGGQQFMSNVISKIDALYEIRENNNYNYLISIDGGINDKTIDKVGKVDFVISGSYICMNDNYIYKINKLKNYLQK